MSDLNTVLAISALIGLVLGLLGGGGSILTLPALVYLGGIPTKEAIASSLFVVGTTSAITTIGRAIRGQVCWKTGLLFGSAGMVGAYFGGRAAAAVPNSALLLLFAGIMFATAYAMLFANTHQERAAQRTGTLCPVGLPVAAIGFDGMLVGGLTGLVGAGGGFVIVPALTLLARLPMQSAVSTSLMILTLQSFAALGGHSQHVGIDPNLAGPVAGVTIAGSLVGATLAPRVNARLMRRLFAILVLGVAAYLVYREANGQLIEDLVRFISRRLTLSPESSAFWTWVSVAILGVLGLVSIASWLHQPSDSEATLDSPPQGNPTLAPIA